MNEHDITPINLCEKLFEDNELKIEFNYEDYGITPDEIITDADNLLKVVAYIPHNELLKLILAKTEKIDFFKRIFPGMEESEHIEKKIPRKNYVVIAVEEILQTATRNKWRLCRNNGQIYLYNGAFWKAIDRDILHNIFGEAAEKMGVASLDAKHYLFRRELILQFESIAYLPPPDVNTETTLINLMNGTFEVSAKKQVLRQPSADDFITYQLPFAYEAEATAPQFFKYLNKVLPDKEAQDILQEYLGYIFIGNQTLKLEKVLLLYGSGANGKSVFIEIVNALLGRENVSTFSLQTLTDPKGYTRAEFANKLLNCSSELSGKIENSDFKLLASGEPIEARHIYGRPFTMENYGKLMFSTNELPKDVEQTNGYFRRWIIIPFEETIPEVEQDKQLSNKIIEIELSGVFNWILEGLKRLLNNKRFTECASVIRQLEEFKMLSDNVQLFITDEGYCKSLHIKKPQKELFSEYRTYCQLNNYRECSNKTFIERLRNAGFESKRETAGNVVYIEKK